MAGDQTVVSTNNHFQDFIENIQDSGINPPETIIPDGKLHRFSSNGKKVDDSGWYVFFDGAVPGGCFGCWRSGFKQNWHAKIGRSLTSREKAEFKASLKSCTGNPQNRRSQASHKFSGKGR